MEELCVPISIQQQLFKNGAISENHAIIEAGFSAAYKYGILIVQASRFFSMQQALEEYISISLIRAVNLSLKNVISWTTPVIIMEMLLEHFKAVMWQ